MSEFWSSWVVVLIVINMGVTFFLFLWAPRAKVPTMPDGTTGHTWANGAIREGMHRLPTWWIVMSFILYASSFTYMWRYPGFGARPGSLGWSAHGQLAEDTTANQERLAAFLQRATTGKTVEQLAGDPEIVAMGQVLFRDNCEACHRRTAHGNPLLGAPDLTDGDWLYGGSGEAIVTTILDGRQGAMPAWGEQLGEEGVDHVAHYVLSLSGAPHDAAKAAAGQAQFAACAACHGPDGKGNQAIGAPNLTDRIWLYGGDIDTVKTTIHGGRSGTMPAWRARLGEQNVHVVAAYVYSLSHGGSNAAK